MNHSDENRPYPTPEALSEAVIAINQAPVKSTAYREWADKLGCRAAYLEKARLHFNRTGKHFVPTQTIQVPGRGGKRNYRKY